MIDGEFTMEFREHSLRIGKGEFIVIPCGMEHRPVAENEVSVMLFEPATTRNTGNVEDGLTRDSLQKI